MIRQVRLLSRIQLCNLFGINELRFTKDRKRKASALALGIVWLFLLLMLEGYIIALSVGLAMLGMSEVILLYLDTIASMIILFFTFLKAGSVIFQMKSYEQLISLPVSKSAIVISRFFSMYAADLMLTMLMVVPGICVYGATVHPGVGFYFYSILGLLFIPMIPITLATAVGAGITAISARMRHKSLVSTVLMVGLVLGSMGVSTLFSGNAEEMAGGLNESMIKELSQLMNDQIARIYPPALWYGKAAVSGDAATFLILMAVSVGIFLAVAAVLQQNFQQVCTALNAARAKNDYQMQKLQQSSRVKALWRRELKRYFDSSIYVTNTIIGYILMAVLAAAICILGLEKMEEILMLPGLLEKVLPLILALVGIIMPITACCISMEGKQLWINQTLPISRADIIKSKILLNGSVALPFYLVTILFGCIAVAPDFGMCVWVIVIPAAYQIFSFVAGVLINLAIPVFDWDNEVRVVKQSASALFTMLVDGAAAAIPIGVVMFLPEHSNLILGITAMVVMVLSVAGYQVAVRGRNVYR